MREKILIVDDDELLLSGLRRTLGRQFELVTEADAESALGLLAGHSFAVVVSDLRMPNMNGIAFLKRVREVSPHSVRIMLTSHADLQAAIDAINESYIFRFLTKPATPPVLMKTLEAGLAQYRLEVAERDLLSKTLLGSVQILMNLLHKIYPDAVQLTARLRKRTRCIAEQLQLPDVWQYELAAMLSQIGLIAAPPLLLGKIQAGGGLNREEQDLVAEYLADGGNLLVNIPRLEMVAEIVGRQNQIFFRSMQQLQPRDRDPILVGAQILQVASHFESLFLKYPSEQDVLFQMYREDRYDLFILDALRMTLIPKAV
jgi:response regulator RpfG family c-di-GMP phosphodiesterase